MQNNTLFRTLLLCGCIASLLVSCSSDGGDNPPPTPPPSNTGILSQFDSGNRAMMQAFYWDVTPQGEWYNTIKPKLEDWATAGIDRIWLASPAKGQSGGYSMGYDPSDYFDLGEYDQHGTVKTRFGSKAELLSLIDTAHKLKIGVVADIVLNHNSGGGLEDNPHRGKKTYTLFDQTHGNASGKFNRNYEMYHPNSIHNNDEEALFFEEQDVCHHQEYVQDWFWKSENSVAKYYKNTIGFDGWRFDYVKGFGAWVVKEWMQEVGGFAVGEYWDGYAPNIAKWVNDAGIAAFDFACFYKMEEAFDRHKDLSYLDRDMLRKIDASKAVTFVANHDTEKDDNQDNRIARSNKMKAYAYILTHSGYPTIFYGDYESSFKSEVQNLLNIHKSIAKGTETNLHTDKNTYIMRRNGEGNNPGLILYINISNQKQTRTVATNWKQKSLKDYSKHTNEGVTTDADGMATISVPANSYTIWSLAE